MKLSKNDAIPVNAVGEAVVGDAFAFVPGVDVDTFLVALRARRRPPTIWAFCILVIGCILVVVVAVLDGMVCVWWAGPVLCVNDQRNLVLFESTKMLTCYYANVRGKIDIY